MTARLFLHIVSLETRKLMAYRVGFWLQAVGAAVAQLLVAYYLWQAVFDSAGSATIGGYSRQEMILYYVLVILLGRIVRGQERESTLARDVYEGSLSRYLVYPADYLAFKYAEHLGNLAPQAIQLLVLGCAVFPFLELPAAVGIGLASVAMCAAAVLAANLLNFLLSYPVEGVAFWAENVWSLNVMVRLASSLLGGQVLPLALFPDWAQSALAWSPFPWLFDFPVNVLLGRVPPHEWALGMAACLLWSAVLNALGRAVWRRGSLVYSGVGM